MAAYECVLDRQGPAPPQQRATTTPRRCACSSGRSQLDPGYAHAHAWKACVLGQTWVYGWCEERGTRRRGQVGRALQTALALDDNDSDVHRILARGQRDPGRHYEQARLPPAARARASIRTTTSVVVQQGEMLTWLGPAGRGHRVDQEGDAPQSLSPGALLEPSGARLLRGPPLRRGDRGAAAASTAPDAMQRALHGRVPRAARRCRRRGRAAAPARLALRADASASATTWRALHYRRPGATASTTARRSRTARISALSRRGRRSHGAQWRGSAMRQPRCRCRTLPFQCGRSVSGSSSRWLSTSSR